MEHSFSMHRVAARTQRFTSVERLLLYGPPERSGRRSDSVGRHNKLMHPSINILNVARPSYSAKSEAKPRQKISAELLNPIEWRIKPRL